MNYSKEVLFNSIFTMNYRGLVYYAQKLLKDDMLAEDLVQDVFVKVWDKMDAFNELKEIKPYLYKCVRNHCLDRLNTRKSHHIDLSFQEQDLAYILDAETISLIDHAIHQLPEGSRKVIELYLSGKKNGEIAQELNLSINTVRAQKQRAIAALRKSLDPESFLLLFIMLLHHDKKNKKT